MKSLLIISLIFLCSCTSLFYQPDRYLYVSPNQFKINFTNQYFHASDGTKLHAWYLKNKQKLKKPRGLVLFYHGNAQNMSSHFTSLAWLTDQGFDLLVFDYRGYGTSEGEPSKEGLYKDSKAALNFGFDLFKKGSYEKFILYGQSLGGALVTKALSEFENSDEVSLLVLDSTFANYKKVASQTLSKAWLTWPFCPLAYLLISNKYATTDDLSKINVPALIIHGAKDRIVPISNGKEIFNKLNSHKKYFWEIPEGNHIDVFAQNTQEHQQQFLKLVNSLSN